ncbi:restriction endonuclease type II-like protein [Stachybotrys elegans]|uniref:Restriction endonuclease type II-like protein n=1 Tax=Stachybotrys elegans TaxID=80388 RepID=A0A8K0SM42_9HYPO|nr:restriction endonuclease type II-like protein [Stachybotrys elegans]
MNDETSAEDAILEAMAASSQMPAPTRIQQPTPQRVTQPTPQRLDRPPPAKPSGAAVVQPTPQALPPKKTVSAIQVSPRQRGNPVLTCIKSMPWEYSDIPADYVLGITTCVLFLSLKYHRLHPEYIYKRIRDLQGKYQLRILLTMVDIPNHEDSLRELSKTSLVNNVTIILCWSAAEAARYLELYKSYENANFSAIRGQQPSSYTERLEDFVTVPRSLNKSDAVALVANFGSLRNAVNAEPEQLGMIAGWGGVKVKRWKEAVEEPFRVRKAAKRGQTVAAPRESALTGSNDDGQTSSAPRPVERSFDPPPRPAGQTSTSDLAQGQFHFLDDLDDEDAEDALLAAALEESKRTSQPGEPASRTEDDNLSGGVAAALARLRNDS